MSAKCTLSQRVSELGDLGKWLSTLLTRDDERAISEAMASGQALYVGRLASRGLSLRAVAVSMLLCSFPSQVPGAGSVVRQIAQHAFGTPVLRVARAYAAAFKLVDGCSVDTDGVYGSHCRYCCVHSQLEYSSGRVCKVTACNDITCQHNSSNCHAGMALGDVVELTHEWACAGLPLCFVARVAVKLVHSLAGVGVLTAMCAILRNTDVTEAHTLLKVLYPVKTSHTGATNKVNVFFSELLLAVGGISGCCDPVVGYNDVMLCASAGLRDDQASAALLYANCSTDFEFRWWFAFLSIHNPAAAKALSTVIKACGMNCSFDGAQMVESQSLLGRGVSPVDLAREAQYRVDDELVAESVIHVPLDLLRSAIEHIVDEELVAADVQHQTLEQHWARRWEWCVNGSHSGLLERYRPEYAVKYAPGCERVYRRMFAEATKRNPMKSWDGHVFVSASTKLECGKSRALFACDTMSYFAFEHFFRPIEKAWRNNRVVLDPGGKGQVSMINRVRDYVVESGFNVMLDYDDFNSQHTIRAQQLVVEVLADKCGYDVALRDRLVRSFGLMHVCLGEKEVGIMKGTLASGHRGTAILNSILNAAYIRVYAGEELYSRAKALHVGDDVYLGFTRLSDADDIVARLQASPCRLNAMKQSMGMVCGEFLRIAITPQHAIGYLARAVGSCVSGNWVTESKLNAEEGLNTMLRCAWTLCNRSCGTQGARLLAPSVARISGLKRKLVRDMILGVAAPNAGPTRRTANERVEYKVKFTDVLEEAQRLDQHWHRDYPRFASRDYLTTGCSGMERSILQATGYSVIPAMLAATYQSMVTGGPVSGRVDRILRCERKWTVQSTVSVCIDDVCTQSREPGALERYPILNLLRNRLPSSVVDFALATLGVESSDYDRDELAWGRGNHGVIVDGFIPHADCCAVGYKSDAHVLWTTYNYFV